MTHTRAANSRTVLSVAVGAALLFASCGSGSGATASGTSPQTTSARQAEVAANGAQVMPFDLNRTMHTFTKTDSGGEQTVTIRTPDDTDQLPPIRQHLSSEADRFRSGDFTDPASIHGADMPGLAELQAGATRMTVTYDELADGARVTYQTSDAALVDAIHRWFDAQLSDHGNQAQSGTMPMGNHTGSMSGQGMSGMGDLSMGAVTDEFDFLTKMIPHHEEAVASARRLLAGTQRPEMVALANNIITTQTHEIDQMRAWLAQWYPGRDTHVGYQPMMRDLTGLIGDELDSSFLQDMLHHHGMAVMMTTNLLADNLATHPDTATLARSIRDSQRTEMTTMTGWLKDWFGLDPMSGMHTGTGTEMPMQHGN